MGYKNNPLITGDFSEYPTTSNSVYNKIMAGYQQESPSHNFHNIISDNIPIIIIIIILIYLYKKTFKSRSKSMDTNQVKRITSPIAQAIFTTSDSGAAKLYSFFHFSNYLLNKVMREYIYFKAFIAVVFLRNIAKAAKTPEAPQEIENILSVIFSILDSGFKHDPIGYGCTISELNSRITYYYQNVDLDNINTFAREFINCISANAITRANVDIFSVMHVCDFAEKYITDTVSKSFEIASQKGSGCLTVIACASVLCLFIYMIL